MTTVSATREILSTLWRDGQYAYLWTDNGKKSKWFRVDEPTAIPGEWKDSNVYFSIHPCAAIPTTNSRGERVDASQVRSQIRLISAINCVFGEFDAKDEVNTKEYAAFLPDDYDELGDIAKKTAAKTAKEQAVVSDLAKFKARAFARIDKAPFPPTLIIDSGGGYHAYWMFTEPVAVTDANRTHIQAVQAAWVDLIGCDPVSKDLARVLRVPGTKNVKPQYAPNFPLVSVVKYAPEQACTFAQIEILTGLDELTTAAKQAQRKTKESDQDKPTDDVISEFNRTHRMVDMLVAQGYTLGWERPEVARLSRPGRDKSQTSVIVFKGGDKEMSYHHSSSDPLYTIGHCWDAFDIYTKTEHQGDAKAAYEAAKREQGKWTDNKRKERKAIDPQTGEIMGLSEVTPKLYLNGNGSHNHTEQPAKDGYAQSEEPTTPTQPTNQPKTKKSNTTSDEYIEALESLGYNFRMNELDDTIEVNGQALNEGLKAEIRTRMRDIGYNKSKVMEDAYTAHAYHNRYHSVKQYLKSLTWQGEDLIAKVAQMVTDQMTPITYPNGTELSVFHAYFKRWIVGAVARAMNSAQNPMLVLVAKQGLGKSRFVNWIGSGIPELFVEGAIKPDNKEHDRMLASKWIWEVGELGATTKRADVEALKDFLTRKTVTFRVPYAVNPITKAALTSFIGTVNPSTGFLTDITGNRRFMTVEVVAINYAYQALDVHQLWGQAMHLYLAGESFELSPEEKARQANDNERHQIEDPYEGWLFRFCDVDPNNAEWSQTTTELTALLQEQGVRGETRTIQMRLSETLRSVGLRQHANARPRRWIGIRVKPVFDK